MATFAVLGSGPSMSQELADFVRDRCPAVAVSDTYRLAPWAQAIVSTDRLWWKHHPAAQAAKCRRFAIEAFGGVEALPRHPSFPFDCSSGLLGMRVAESLGATRLLLLGFDMHGTHFFGRHPPPLWNTSEGRFRVLIQQYDKWRGCDVINCTPGSALTRFPSAKLIDML